MYENRIQLFLKEKQGLIKRDNLFSIGRLVLFFAMLFIAIFIFQWNVFAGIAFIYLSISAFYFIVKNHDQIKTEKQVLQSLINLNEAEIKALDNDNGSFANGARYMDDKHPFIMDLDLFGKKGLFEKINRCASIFGENQLASILKEHLHAEDIIAQQQANAELENELEWRQRFYAIGHQTEKNPEQIKHIFDWAASKETFQMPLLWMILVPVLTIGAFIYLCISGNFNISWIAFIPTAYLTFKNAKRITAIQMSLSKHIKSIKTFSSLIKHIENKSFESKKLQNLQAVFLENNIPASKHIKKLSFYLHQLDQRLNIFTAIFNLLFLWDHIWVNKIYHWKKDHANKIKLWFQTMGSFEALNSTAGLGFNNPSWCFPSISEEPNLEAIGIGHPLIHSDKMVTNDFKTASKQHIKIITGSNMGGKSTFLRTIGINGILAYAGAKVCAEKLSIPMLQFYTSMRTKDDLSDNTSSFYAELKRLKMVLEAVQSNDNIYFLLDEILKGTNTKDRHKGAKALILELLKNKGAGLISTHDLELGKLEADHQEQIENLCFEVETKGEELIFDYKIKKGISQSFNATQLMKNIGIDV